MFILYYFKIIFGLTFFGLLWGLIVNPSWGLCRENAWVPITAFLNIASDTWVFYNGFLAFTHECMNWLRTLNAKDESGQVWD